MGRRGRTAGEMQANRAEEEAGEEKAAREE